MTGRTWHVFVHAWTGSHSSSSPELVEGVPALPVTAESVREPFALTFEEVVAGVAGLPGSWVEPDGALVWNPAPGEQVVGTIHCFDHRVMSVELHVACGAEHWRKFLDAAVGAAPTCVQLAERGVFVSADGLARLLGSRSG